MLLDVQDACHPLSLGFKNPQYAVPTDYGGITQSRIDAGAFNVLDNPLSLVTPTYSGEVEYSRCPNLGTPVYTFISAALLEVELDTDGKATLDNNSRAGSIETPTSEVSMNSATGEVYFGNLMT